MGLVSTISNAANGLGVIQVQTATASHNIANANTDGYSRQYAVQTEAVPSVLAGGRGYIGSGIVLKGVYQLRDAYVEQQLPTAFSNSASSTAQSDSLAAVSALNPDETGNLTTAMGNFYTSLRGLAQNASDSGLRQAAADSARVLAATFNRTAVSLETARDGVDENIINLVNVVNATSESIAELNRRISPLVMSGQSPNDLLDKRQQLMDKLSGLIGAKPVPDDRGNLSMVLPGGTTLVNGTLACKLKTQSDPGNKGHIDVAFAPADGSPDVVLNRFTMGGQIAGLITGRDVALGGASTALDNLAFEFGTMINGHNTAGFTVTGGAGGNVFDVGAISTDAAFNIKIDANLAADPGLWAAAGTALSAPADASNLQALIASEQTTLSTGLNAEGSLGKVISDFGVLTQSAKDSAAFDKAVLQHLGDSRESASGVSVDDEMVNLTRSQRAYQALSKVITTADDMLKSLMDVV
jgi:flagellar hook-associated protein 1 FlgK